MPEDFFNDQIPRNFRLEKPGFDNFRANPEQDKELLYVPMGFAEATRATDPRPKIGTTSLASCAGIGLYDPENKVGGVAHVFFNEKTTHTWTTYMRDSQGRDIPSTGKMHYQTVDDPYWYHRFESMMNELLHKTTGKGGRSYEFHGFNVLQGARTAEQNKKLAEFAQELVKKLHDKGTFTGEPDWQMWQGFTLDTRTGLFTPSM